MNKWQPIETALKDGKKCLLFYKNCLGKNRTILGFYIQKFSKEASYEFEEGDYDEKTDEYYYPEGWWELIDNWDDYNFVAITPNIPTHWMPLPEPPENP